MRRVVRRFLVFLVAAGSFLIPPGAVHAAERRVIVTPEADYPGFDFQTIKGTDAEACQAACLDEPTCHAFTFNVAAGWCFLKSDFGALAATSGAIAGRVVTTPALTPTLTARRLAELGFLSQDVLDETRALVGDLKRRSPPPRLSFGALVAAGIGAYGNGQYDAAARAFGQALTIADDDAGAWRDFSNASLGRSPDSWSERQEAARDATGGAVNAYLRAETTADQATALTLLADALAKREIWKPAIRAYRASLALVEAPALRTAYEQVVAEHGFRILSHEVEADSAVPQICIRFSDALAVTRPDLADYVSVEGGDGLAVEPQDNQICIDGIVHGGRYVIRLRGGLPAADGEALVHPVELNVYVRDRAP